MFKAIKNDADADRLAAELWHKEMDEQRRSYLGSMVERLSGSES
jgi:hypothetical protein